MNDVMRRPRRWTLSHRLGYAQAAAVIALCLFASVVPSPLYSVYAQRWHFSPLTLTLIFATYAFGVLAALLLAGRLSDQVGRRPVLSPRWRRSWCPRCCTSPPTRLCGCSWLGLCRGLRLEQR